MTKNIQTLKKMPITLDKSTVGVEEAAQLGMLPADDWTLMLINMTDKVMTRQRLKIGTGSWTGWSAMAPVGRTCNLATPQECYGEHLYSPVMTIACGGLSFSIELRDANGYGAIWDGIIAGCEFAGGVITLG